MLHDFVLHHLVAGHHDRPPRRHGVPRCDGARGGRRRRGCSATPSWTSAFRRCGRTGRRTSTLAGEVLGLATGLIVHSRYVRDRARAAGLRRADLGRAASGVPGARRSSRSRSRASPLFAAFGNVNASKRVPQLLEAFARVRAEPPGGRLLLVGATSPGFDLDRRLQRLGLDGAGLVREGYVDEDRLWGLMAACRRPRQPPLADDGRDLRHRDSRARARQAARRQRRRLVRGAAGRRRAEGARSTSDEVDTLDRCARAARVRAPTCARRWATAALELAPQRARPRPRRRSLRRGLRAGGGRRCRLATPCSRDVSHGGRRGGDRARLARRARDRARGSARSSSVVDRLRAVPAWAMARRDRRRSRSPCGRGSPAACSARSSWSTSSSTRRWRRASPPTCRFAVRGVPARGYGAVYPILISPGVRGVRPDPGRLRGDQDDQQPRHVARRGARVLHRPPRRRQVAWRSLAALLAVAVPSMVYTATVMTENAYYPRLPARRAGARGAARAAVDAQPGPVLRGLRAGVPDALAGDRRRRCRGDGADPARPLPARRVPVDAVGVPLALRDRSSAARCSSSPPRPRAGCR